MSFLLYHRTLTMWTQVSGRQGSPLGLKSPKAVWMRTLTHLYVGATCSPHWVQLLPSAKLPIDSDELANPGPTKWRVTNGRDIISGFAIPWCVLCYCCYSCAPAAHVEPLLFQPFISAPRHPNPPLRPSVISPAYRIPLARKQGFSSPPSPTANPDCLRYCCLFCLFWR